MATDRPPGKTRITIRLDTGVIAWFRREVRSSEGSYQTAINAALRDYIAREPLESTLRRVVREELATAAGNPPESAYAYGMPPPASLVADAVREDYGNPARRGRPGSRPKRASRRQSGKSD